MTYLITNYQPARPDQSLGQFSIHTLEKNYQLRRSYNDMDLQEINFFCEPGENFIPSFISLNQIPMIQHGLPDFETIDSGKY